VLHSVAGLKFPCLLRPEH